MDTTAIAVMWTYVQCCWSMARTPVPDDRDRGSASVEHILWYLAAGLGTVAVATIVCVAIKGKASEPLPQPSAP